MSLHRIHTYSQHQHTYIMEGMNIVSDSVVYASTENVDGEDQSISDNSKTDSYNEDFHSLHDWETLKQCIVHLTQALRELQEKMDIIQESRNKSGCGFSCSNNSFTL